MSRFFSREKFTDSEITAPFYEYLGYQIDAKTKDSKTIYPLKLTFGKNAIYIIYRHNGFVKKIFSLYVAEGEINQEMLTRKVENYWKMPLWHPEDLSAIDSVAINTSLLSIGYFPLLFGFRADKHGISEQHLFQYNHEEKESLSITSNNELKFIYNLQGSGSGSGEAIEEHWRNGFDRLISVSKQSDTLERGVINFRKILLDLLFELDNTNTFEDENFFHLQPVIQNNTLLDALTKKCHYLKQLNSLHSIEVQSVKSDLHDTVHPRLLSRLKSFCHNICNKYKRNEPLNKQFIEAEKSWLKVCFSDDYSSIFNSCDSIFSPVEREVELVNFHAYISCNSNKLNNRPLKRINTFSASDSAIRNQLATFYLRRYSLINAFLTLIPWHILLLVGVLTAFIPFADYFMHFIVPDLTGIYCLLVPSILFIGFVLYYKKYDINLFKLLLPRMSLGILLGWTAFWSSADLLKGLLLLNKNKLIPINILVFTVLFLYICTDIRNKLIKTKNKQILLRAFVLILFAGIISLVQGFYITQFAGEAMLQSDYQFLGKDNASLFCDQSIDSSFSDCQFNEIQTLQKLAGIIDHDLGSSIKTLKYDKSKPLEFINANLDDPSFYKKIKNIRTRTFESSDSSFVYEQFSTLKKGTVSTYSDDDLKSIRRGNRLLLQALYSSAVPKAETDKPDGSNTYKVLGATKWLLPQYKGRIFTEIRTGFIGKWIVGKLIFLWPILWGQFMISILIGLVLQLLWEDRPITEPL